MRLTVGDGERPDLDVVKEGGYRPTTDPGPVPEVLVRDAADVEPEQTDDRATIDPPRLKPVDQELVKALAHETKVSILQILSEREASPSELAKLVDGGLSQVSYHVKRLKDNDIIQLVRTEARRGAVEHFYRARPAESVPRVLEVMASEESPVPQDSVAD